MKKIVFLFWSLAFLVFTQPTEASTEEPTVSYETVKGESVLVIEVNGGVPFRIERGDGSNRYNITQNYYEDGRFIFFGYAEIEETHSLYDGYVLVVSETGVIEHEHLIDDEYLEEVKHVLLDEETLYVLVDKSMDKRPDIEFMSSMVYAFNEDEMSVLYESEVSLKRFKVEGDALFVSEKYSGTFEKALLADGTLLKEGEIHGIEDGGQYKGNAAIYTLCEDSQIEGEKIENFYEETYPGHYVFACGDNTLNFTVHPIVEGVKLFETKQAPLTLSVSEGRIWLDDDLYVSGSLIDEPGYHTLKVEGANGYELRRSFTLTSGLEGVSDGETYREALTLFFTGEATLNESDFSSGSTISESGEYKLLIKGHDNYTEIVTFTLELNEQDSVDNLKIEYGIVAGTLFLTGGGLFLYKKRK